MNTTSAYAPRLPYNTQADATNGYHPAADGDMDQYALVQQAAFEQQADVSDMNGAEASHETVIQEPSKRNGRTKHRRSHRGRPHRGYEEHQSYGTAPQGASRSNQYIGCVSHGYSTYIQGGTIVPHVGAPANVYVNGESRDQSLVLAGYTDSQTVLGLDQNRLRNFGDGGPVGQY